MGFAGNTEPQYIVPTGLNFSEVWSLLMFIDLHRSYKWNEMKLKWTCTHKHPLRTNSLAHLGRQRKTLSNLLGRNGNGSLTVEEQTAQKVWEAVKVWTKVQH